MSKRTVVDRLMDASVAPGERARLVRLANASEEMLAVCSELVRASVAAQPYIHAGCHTNKRHNRANNELITASKIAAGTLARLKG